jgi:hypothetical protein
MAAAAAALVNSLQAEYSLHRDEKGRHVHGFKEDLIKCRKGGTDDVRMGALGKREERDWSR